MRAVRHPRWLLWIALATSLAHCVPDLDRSRERASSVRAPDARIRVRRRAAVPRALSRAPSVPSTLSAPSPSRANAPGAPARLRVTFIDVGQGDASLLESDDGHAAMIDAGPPEAGAHLREVLAAHGVGQLDWVIFTHPHLDHIGGALDLLDSVRVARVIDPAIPHPTATYDRLLARIQQRAIPFGVARSGEVLSLGPHVSVEILAPSEPLISGTRSDVNANSVVVRVTAGSVRMLFAGDAERESEERLLVEGAERLRADVLKVAHHGSRYATTEPFLQAVSPRYAVISCGEGNSYGHPHASTLDLLVRRGVEFFRTDLQGDIVVATDGVHVSVAPSRQAPPEAMTRAGLSRGRAPREE